MTHSISDIGARLADEDIENAPSSTYQKTGGDYIHSCVFASVAVFHVSLIVASLIADTLLLFNVYYENEDRIFFGVSLSVICFQIGCYTLSSCFFFCSLDFSSFGVLERPIQGFLSLPPHGVLFTMFFMPGVQVLPYQIGSNIAQYLINATFFFVHHEYVKTWNTVAFCLSGANIVLTPMFSWIQQSFNTSELSVSELFFLFRLWLF
eukprot:UN34005